MRTRYLTSLVFLSFAAFGCDLSGLQTPDSIGAAIEMENGGLTMDDEAPAFGDAEAFAEADATTDYERVDDDVEDDADVRELRDRPDAAVYNVVVKWGQIPGNRENRMARNWSGKFGVNRGAVVVRKLIEFEPRTDKLLRRDDRKKVPFTSITRPHHDGMILTIIDPTPEADEPLVLGYINALTHDGEPMVSADARVDVVVDHSRPEDTDRDGVRCGDEAECEAGDVFDEEDRHATDEIDVDVELLVDAGYEDEDGVVRPIPAPTGVSFRIAVERLLDGRVELLRDDAGNRMVAAANVKAIDVCDAGFMAGHWKPVSETRGRFIGRVANDEGDHVGHVRGIYGVRANGEAVFFGKYINLEGEFRGILRGSYGGGEFEGRWLHRAGDHGVVRGKYNNDPDERGGDFIGRWAETSCNLDL